MTKLLKQVFIPSFVTCFVITSAYSGQTKHEGEELYYGHLCNHCHGENGKKPKNDIIPIIGGKDAKFLKKEAKEILDGTRKGRAVVMHAKYYSAEATSGSCDIGPKNDELDKIAEWLAKQ